MRAFIFMCVCSLLILAEFTLAIRYRRQQDQNVGSQLMSDNKTSLSESKNQQDNLGGTDGVNEDNTNLWDHNAYQDEINFGDDTSVPIVPLSHPLPDIHGTENNETQKKCHTDWCEISTFCNDDQVCVMTSKCFPKCVVNGTSVTEIEITTTELPTNDNDGLRPLPERSCDDPNMYCLHGVPSNCSGKGFSCLCDEGWSDIFCQKPCTLKCVHGQCQNNDGTMRCSCKHTYTGRLCEALIPDPEESQKILALILSSALAVALITAIAIPVVMWKLRMLLIIKIIYIFKQYEDDDGKENDAYISMTATPSAESFVYGSLRPMLENMNFKLYLPERDASVGGVISENIITALENSRRTIMIITNDYITNEWSRFEYLIAQHETLKLQQRIIPIILEDIEEERVNMDKSLKHILDSIKCLTFPELKLERKMNICNLSESIQSPYASSGACSTTNFYGSGKSSSTNSGSKEEKKFEKKVEKFWKRLMLTMPKKKSKDKKSANIFEKLRTNARNGITSSSEKNGDVKFETKEYKIQNNLDFDTKINVVNDVNDYNMCESTIVNQQKSEQNKIDYLLNQETTCQKCEFTTSHG